jgi:hypothetical protein
MTDLPAMPASTNWPLIPFARPRQFRREDFIRPIRSYRISCPTRLRSPGRRTHSLVPSAGQVRFFGALFLAEFAARPT